MAPGGSHWRGGAHKISGKKPCRLFSRTGNCSYGARCKFAHVTASNTSSPRHGPPNETQEQQDAKTNYNVWKRLIKTEPRANDIRTMEAIWTGALEILNSDDKDWKQQLPRDLDDDATYGKQHIKVLLSLKTHTNGSGRFVKLVLPFLQVITHQSLLDCLSMDTAVGCLYNFFGGSNGTPALAFFENCCTNMLESKLGLTISGVDFEKRLYQHAHNIAGALRREQRSVFNEDLPKLLNSIENVICAGGIEQQSLLFQILHNMINELRGMIARAQGLIHDAAQSAVEVVSTTVVRISSLFIVRA